VRGLHGKEERIEILKRKAAFDDDPVSFAEKWKGEQDGLAASIVAAREQLSHVVLDDAALESIVAITTALRLDGHRPDIVIMKAARALAAYRGLSKVSSAEIRDAAGVALSHRQKRLPFEEPGSERAKLQNILEEMAA
jgi:magnesium chelatase subunit I